LSSEPEKDDVLVERAQGGSADAFRELVERYQRPVLGLIARMVADRGTAEDLAQDVFVRAYRYLADFDRERRFASWLFKIAHNRTIDHLRRQRLVQWLPLEAEGDNEDSYEVLAAPESASPERGAQAGELRELLQAAIAALRPNYREILLLRFEQDLQYHEIADIQGIALGTVKVQLHRARKALAVELRRRGVTPAEEEATGSPAAGLDASGRV
jgi:RNA polymerase sigma-70 factor (ECF subfamily)